ncbi:MAG: threonine synthase [Planctomycetota bacterium]
MKFIGTRSGEECRFEDALVRCLDGQGGLFVPESLPWRSFDEWGAMRSEEELLTALLQPFLEDSALSADDPRLLSSILEWPRPLKSLRENLGILELFHGPTAAFKDFGASFLAKSLALSRSGAGGTILVATSGDTGSAVAAAFSKLEGFRVILLYPRGRVSGDQERLLSGWGDSVRSFAVEGSFDDAQAMVKAVLSDTDYAQKMSLFSANSINLGRLLPQAYFYLKSSCDIFRTRGKKMSVVVPSGNLGNGLAAIWARAMGAPIQKIVLAANANDAIAPVLKHRSLHAKTSVKTLATAMDVGTPSNAERLLWQLEREQISVDGILSCASSDADITSALIKSSKELGRPICPHTATALDAYGRHGEGSEPWVLAATAHPAKFADTLFTLTGESPLLPSKLREHLERESSALPMEANQRALRMEIEAFDGS